MTVREREVAPVGAEVLGTAQDRAGRQEAGKAFETLLPEQKWKEKMADTGCRGRGKQKNGSSGSYVLPCQASGQFAWAATFQLEINDTSIGTMKIPWINTSRHNALRIRRISEANLRREG